MNSSGVPAAAPPLLLVDLPASRFIALVCALAGTAAVLVAVLVDPLFGGAPGFGTSQRLLAATGAVLLASAAALAARRPDRRAWEHVVAVQIDRLLRFAPVAAEVALVVVVLRWFRIESPVFHQQIAGLTFGGFVAHHILPLRMRLPFFALLSMAGVVVVFWPTGGFALLGIGLALIAICHLPVALGVRIGMLLAAGALLALLRAEVLPSVVPAAIWPILGSMFMFRLILYVYELKHGTERPGVARTLAYFFLLPNVAFPLFPVVDFATFRRTWYDRPELEIYRSGVRWMLLGITHLLAYRLVYQHFTLPASEVAGGLDLARYMVATFLLYLKVSGQFHLIVGMLHLFGFRLPESHRFFYLAASFPDLWRRINIYWKDFMAKVFYFPAYFRLRRRGDTFALVLSTLFVFAATWALHSYQWFWLLGTVLLSWPDTLFWGLLAVLLVVASIRENRRGRTRALGGGVPSLPKSLRHGLAVATTFTVMCTLWSLWSSHTIADWLRLWRNAGLGMRDAAGGMIAFAVVVCTIAIGHQVHARTRNGAAGRRRVPSAAANVAWLGALLLLGGPALTPHLGVSAQAHVRDLRIDKLNRADADLLHRGYYENLTGVNQFNSRLWEAYAMRPSEWKQIWQTEAVRETEDFLKWEVRPLAGIIFNGTTLRTNRWGMRDRDYEIAPAAGTWRMALAGSSFAMGQGVNDHETFEQLVEDRLNAEVGGAHSFEILNFSGPAFTPIELLYLFEQRIVEFSPDVLIIAGHPYDTENSARHTARMFLDGRVLPYAYLDSLLARAGVQRGMSLNEASERLWREPYKQELVRWTLARVAERARDAGVEPVWLLFTTPGVEIPAEEIDWLIEAASDAGFAVFDVRDAYGNVADADLRVAPWDSHPNALAHRLLARRVYDVLLSDASLLGGAGADGLR